MAARSHPAFGLRRRMSSAAFRSTAAHRKFLEHQSREATLGERMRDAQVQRAESAFKSAVSYLLPKEAVAEQAAHAERAGSQVGNRGFGFEGSNHVERQIEKAVLEGAFDNLPGRMKPRPREHEQENVFEVLAGESTAHRILKQAGCAPLWVERGKEIRTGHARARAELRDAYLDFLEQAVARTGKAGAASPTGMDAAAMAGRVAEARVAAVAAAAAVARSKERLARFPASGGGSLELKAARKAVAAARDVASRAVSGATHAAGAPAAPLQPVCPELAGSDGGFRTAVDGESEARWEEAVRLFERCVAETNRRIVSYNLIVPGLWQQLPPLALGPAIERAIHEAEGEGDRTRGLRPRSNRPHRATGQSRQHSFTAFGATFAMADVQMPSVASVLAEVFGPRRGGTHRPVA
jgi:hypothetical protein